MKTIEDALKYADTFEPHKQMSIVMLAAEVRRLQDVVKNAQEHPAVALLYVEGGRIEDIPWQEGLKAYPDGNLHVYAAAPAISSEWREFAQYAARLKAGYHSKMQSGDCPCWQCVVMRRARALIGVKP